MIITVLSRFLFIFLYFCIFFYFFFNNDEEQLSSTPIPQAAGNSREGLQQVTDRGQGSRATTCTTATGQRSLSTKGRLSPASDQQRRRRKIRPGQRELDALNKNGRRGLVRAAMKGASKMAAVKTAGSGGVEKAGNINGCSSPFRSRALANETRRLEKRAESIKAEPPPPPARELEISGNKNPHQTQTLR